MSEKRQLRNQNYFYSIFLYSNCSKIGIDMNWCVCSTQQHFHMPGDWGEPVDQPQSFCSHVMSLRLSACYCSGSNSPNLPVKPELWCCFCGENKTSREQTWKTCIICSFLRSPVFSDLRSESHTHLVYSCQTGHLFHQAVLHQKGCFLFFFFLNEPVTQT